MHAPPFSNVAVSADLVDYFQAFILGLAQGLTEFLPVSSSGHLVILQNLMSFGAGVSNIVFDILLHVATVLAVCWVYRKDLLAIFRGTSIGNAGSPVSRGRLIGLLVLSLLATGVALPFKDVVEKQFETISSVGFFLLINSVLLWRLPLLKKGTRGLGEMRWWEAVAVGLAQGIAVLPGISRSGLTIMAGLVLGISPKEACRYSFLLSIPAILLAALAGTKEVFSPGTSLNLGLAATGAVVALVSALLTIPILVGAVEKGKLWGFAIYCAVLGISVCALNIVA